VESLDYPRPNSPFSLLRNPPDLAAGDAPASGVPAVGLESCRALALSPVARASAMPENLSTRACDAGSFTEPGAFPMRTRPASKSSSWQYHVSTAVHCSAGVTGGEGSRKLHAEYEGESRTVREASARKSPRKHTHGRLHERTKHPGSTRKSHAFRENVANRQQHASGTQGWVRRVTMVVVCLQTVRPHPVCSQGELRRIR